MLRDGASYGDGTWSALGEAMSSGGTGVGSGGSCVLTWPARPLRGAGLGAEVGRLGGCDGFGAVSDAQFDKDGGHIVAYGFLGDAEAACNFGVGFVPGHPGKDLDLSRCQSGEGVRA